MAMLAIYDHLDEILNARRRSSPVLRFYASDVMEQMGSATGKEVMEALNRAIYVCTAAGLPVEDNFRQIYRFDGENLIADSLLSSMGCYLLILNGNPLNPLVAKAQLSFSSFSSMASVR